jgi:hypothetical protein
MIEARSSRAAVAVVAAAALAIPTAAAAKVAVVAPTGYQSNGDLIAGWNWLRAPGHTATWTFPSDQLKTAKPGSIHLNLGALVTNKASGGSGFSATVRLTITGQSLATTRTVFLKNPFRPNDPDDSGGIGYAAYGASSSIPTSLLKNVTGPITVAMSFPHVTRKTHVAVKQDSLSFGYRLTVASAPKKKP